MNRNCHAGLFTLTMLGASLSTFQAPAISGEGDWTQFRGPTGQGHSQSSSLPLTWSPTENVRWAKDLDGNGWSSPVVKNSRVYVTSALPIKNSDDLWLCLLILDGRTGNPLNRVDLFRHDATTAPNVHSKNSHASATPIIDADRVYAHFGHAGTACVDLDGNLIWANDTIDYQPVHGNGGSPVIVDDLLVFSCDGREDPFVTALDKYTGESRWRVERHAEAPKKFSFSTPLAITVNGASQIVSPGSNCVVAYDPATGSEVWRVRYEGYSVVPRPVYGHGMVYVSTSFDSPKVMAIRPDGNGDVTDTHVVWVEQRAAPNTPSMLLVGEHVYMVSDRGVASCLQAVSGKTVWRERLGGNYSASPLHADGRIYFQSEEGETIVVAAGNEFRELARNDLQDRTLASLSVIDGDFLIRTETKLYRVGERSRRF